jgi:hypothetical protein
MIKARPSPASQRRIDCQLVKIPEITVRKAEPRNFKPRRILICENITVVAAAEQKPKMTGPDIKSMTKP